MHAPHTHTPTCMHARRHKAQMDGQVKEEKIEEKQTKKTPKQQQQKVASTGNRTRVTRVAGEYFTTRPPMLHGKLITILKFKQNVTF